MWHTGLVAPRHVESSQMSEICIDKTKKSDNDPELGASDDEKKREMKIASQLIS